MRIALPQQVYPQNERVLQFWEQLLPRVNGLPGVASATMISGMPPVRPINANDTQIEGWVEREGGPGQNIDYYQTVGDRFLEAMGARLVEGRMFDERDGTNAPASLVINQTMARMYWPGQSAIGKRVRPGFRDPWRTVVGVIADIKNAGVDKATGTELFLPVRQSQGFGLRNAFLVIRTHGEPAGIARAARAEISALDASLPVSQVRTMEDAMALAKARPRFLTGLLSTFSGLALVLAGLGIYGVMSYLVAQRTNEFGVRMAIGARQSDVLWMVIRQGMWLGMLGVASGALCAAGLARYLKGMLYATDALDPATFLSMAAALTAVVILACFLPALRATRVDPIRALRYE
ncbi:MAG: FtsX-like permease family protein [Bryobacterales bacterium]|nr:FtsX-like permease family protein [Bryobacterales bacterium]